MPRKWPNILGLVNPGPDGVEAVNSRLGQLPGWVVFNRSMARDRQVYSGDDYTEYTDANVGVICCLEWDHGEGGTIPAPGLIKPFLLRCQAYVEACSGCHVWIVGNEMNAISNWPLTAQRSESISFLNDSLEVLEPRYRPDRYPLLFGAPAGEIQEGHFPVTPGYYVECFVQVRECIKSLPGHEQDLVLVGAVAPWNTDAKDAENPSGDWIHYFTSIVSSLQGGQCEGFALHTATLGPDPDNLPTDQFLDFPFGGRRSGFRCFEDFIAAVPPQHRGLPFFITETSQLQPWLDANDGWVLSASNLIQAHNRTKEHSPIRCLALYQWGPDSPWSMRDRSYLLADIRDTLFMLADQTRKSTLCEVVWEWSEIPETLVKGELVTASVSFSNNSGYSLACSGDDPVRLALFFQAEDISDSFQDSIADLRFPLPKDVGIGEAQTCHFALQVPAAVGAYRMFVGVVKPQFVWSAAELEGAFVHSVSVVETAEEVPDSKTSNSSHEQELAPFIHSASDLVGAQDTDVNPSAMQLETTVPEESTETPKLAISSEKEAEERDIPEDVVPELALPAKFELFDLTAFFSRDKAEVSKRMLTSLNRIVFIETGLPSHTPMDSFLDHFVGLGLEGMPMHFLQEDKGPVFQVLPLTTNPLSYSQNWASAIVLGLEGKATSQEEAKERLQQAAKVCASILQAQVYFGVPSTWEIGLDSIDGELPFRNLTLVDLEEVKAALEEQWQLLGMSLDQLEITPVDLPLEAKQGEGKREIAEAQPDPYSGITDIRPAEVETGFEPSASQNDLEPLPQEDPLWAPLTSPPKPDPLDLRSNGSSYIEYNYREKTSIFLWATGSSGDAPITQLNRLHDLQFGDILYHFVIDSDGQVFETHRGTKPDENLVPPYKNALHIGLQGDFKMYFPPESQTDGCSLLLARLAKREAQSATQGEPGGRPINIGTENWIHKDDWRERVLNRTSQVSELLRTGKGIHSEDADQSSKTDSPVSEPTPEVSTAPASQVPEEGFAPASKISDLQTSLSESVPRLVNKIGTMPTHPRMVFPKRRLEQISSICIHHSGVPGIVGPEQIAQSLLLDQSSSDSPLYGLPYHFFVHPDGQIDHCVSLDEVCHGMEKDNELAISVALAGKFTDSVNPTPDQLGKAATLIKWLMRGHFLNIDDLKGHKEIDEVETVCPGEEWAQGRAWKETLLHYIQ